MEVELKFGYFWIQALREQFTVAEMHKKSYQANRACFQLGPLYLKREDREVHRVIHKHEPQHSALFTEHKGTVNIKLLQGNDRVGTMTAAL